METTRQEGAFHPPLPAFETVPTVVSRFKGAIMMIWEIKCQP